MTVDVVSRAEDIVRSLERRKFKLTTSQLRKFLAAVNSIQNRADVWKNQQVGLGRIPEKLPEELAAEIRFLQVKLAYQAGRTGGMPVKDFMYKSKIVDDIKEIGDSLEKFEQFADLVEAIVAFHKYYGGGN